MYFMAMYFDERIPLYLNLACRQVTRDSGDLKFLTGSSGTTVTCGGRENQETQVLKFGGSTIWIANNDDADTLMMKAFLDKLGIDSLEALSSHVEDYAARLYPSRKAGEGTVAKANISDGTAVKVKLLAELQAQEMISGKTVADIEIPDPKDLTTVTAVSNKTYKLSSSNAPPADGIVFVTGNYDGDKVTGGDQHAEQKLLAALSKAPSTMTGAVRIIGCKSACSTCETVLLGVRDRLKGKMIVSFQNQNVDNMRTDLSLGKKNTSTIRDLALDTYFPA
ncbi:MAG: hypothetical protein AAFP68_01335 [Pseudomonadota bacterium]